jgi:hypothetical protein
MPNSASSSAASLPPKQAGAQQRGKPAPEPPDKAGPKQGADGRFLPGNNGGFGRPKGSRNKLGDDFLKALATDFEEHGTEVIAKVRETKPEVYLRVVADLLPKNVKVDGKVGLSGDDMSDEERRARIVELLGRAGYITDEGGS